MTRKAVRRTSGSSKRTRLPNKSSARQTRSRVGEHVLLISNGKELARIDQTTDFKAVVTRWAYVLRNRSQWAARVKGKEEQAALARKEMGTTFGIDALILEKIAFANYIEVSIPSGTENNRPAWAVPWEYLISAGTSHIRASTSLLITRQLRTERKPVFELPKSLLFVENAPGRLSADYEFSSERKVVIHGLDLPDRAKIEFSKNESEADVRSKIRKGASVIHFTGFDIHQANRLLRTRSELSSASEGLAVRSSGTSTNVAALTPYDVETEIAASRWKPTMVAFNCYNSGSALAPGAILGGAEVSLGFYDEIDDDIAEFFFGAFYREWRATNWNAVEAFRKSWEALRGSGANLHGTGIVLWTSALARDFKPPSDVSISKRKKAEGDNLPPSDQLEVEPKLVAEINYSLLHNEQPIFSSFVIKRINGSKPLQVEVTVELNVGLDSYPFRTTEVIGNKPLLLTQAIKIPLTSSLSRSLRERVQSTIYVKVACGKDVVYQRTSRVTLLPVDEWSDDSRAPTQTDVTERRSVWLPSFVLPRDPAIPQVIDVAQKYLMALADDPSVGFDGYQQVGPDHSGPHEVVNAQVRAIWHALSLEYRLSYINPPPAYSRQTQRLRTPSDIIEGKRGTCIDLALLFAACLEYVEIYPVVILLKGHAFPAYWSSENGREKFLSGHQLANEAIRSMDVVESRYSWVLGRSARQLSEIMRCTQRGDLVPLETVWLTNYSGFAEAQAAGVENLSDPGEFDSLLDIMQARSNNPPVTPVPIIQL